VTSLWISRALDFHSDRHLQNFTHASVFRLIHTFHHLFCIILINSDRLEFSSEVRCECLHNDDGCRVCSFLIITYLFYCPAFLTLAGLNDVM